MKAANSSRDLLATAIAPLSLMRLITSGSLRTLVKAANSLLTIGRGVPAGA